MEEFAYRLFKRRLGTTGKPVSEITDISRIKEIIPTLDKNEEYFIERYSFTDDGIGLELNGFDIFEVNDETIYGKMEG